MPEPEEHPPAPAETGSGPVEFGGAIEDGALDDTGRLRISRTGMELVGASSLLDHGVTVGGMVTCVVAGSYWHAHVLGLVGVGLTFLHSTLRSAWRRRAASPAGPH
jgi:hypothetical protein